MLRYAFLAALGLIATTDLLSAQTAPTESPPAAAPPAVEPANSIEAMEDPQTGDHWTYELRDDITGDVKSTITNTVTDVSGSEISIRIAQLGNSNSGYQTFDRSWNLTNNGIWRYAPHDGTGIRTPLAVGKTWSLKSTDLNSTAGVSWKRSSTAKVVAQESVTTRAGTFDTFKIETSFQMQNANDPTRKVQAVQQLWYAPAIDHWVKRSYVSRSDGRVRDKSTIELVEYGRR
ncbi:MAG: hypothetical protein E8A46_07775 [Bradyrhizobium sp.]|jgi:hypothetical protein|uniref:TapB family protein n=1 Tax=Bradyrhizobium sp. TaxID=376 RepID=UPI00122ABD00|nr:hypothetical protein [Bradyrhizobium sp.]THD54761.1 MAG: hypothetical protein E8A46_07775 [Bradyrhizobium sp.]